MLISYCHVTIDGFRLTPLGEPPSPRAAHVATAVGTMVVIQVLHVNGFFYNIRSTIISDYLTI